MTQLDSRRRQRRRHHWFNGERPALLVRLRLAAAPSGVIAQYRETSWTKRDGLRRAVHFWEARTLKELAERS